MDPAGLRLEPLRAWLADAGILGSDGGELAPSLLAGGRSNISYRLTCDEVDLVLRRPPLGHILPSAHDMGREFRVLSGLGRVGFPVPRTLVLCEDDGVIGSTFVVMEFVDGRVIDTADDARALTDPAAVCRSLVDTLADLHRVDPAAAGLSDLGRPGGYVQRQVRRWQQQWELTRTRELVQVDRLGRELDARVARLTGERAALVHGDYRLDNTILDPVDPDVRAVVDWEMATLGDPLMDLAVLLVYWTQAGDGRRREVPVAQHVTDQPRFWTRAEVVERYASRSGIDLGDLDVCTAVACFKLSVIMESILARSLQGQQLGAGAQEVDGMRAATEALADLGLAVLADGAVAGLAR